MVGFSLRQTAAQLSAGGYETAWGREWTAAVVNRILGRLAA